MSDRPQTVDTEGRMKPKNCTCSGVYHHDDSCPAHCLFPTGCINDPCSGRIGHDTECCTFRGTVATKDAPKRELAYLTDAGLVQRVWTRDNADLCEELLARLNERKAETDTLRRNIETANETIGRSRRG